MSPQTTTGKMERFTRNLPLAKYACKQWQVVFKKYRIEADDAYQLVLEGLWRACISFDESRGERCWSTYAMRSMWGTLRVHIIEYFQARKRQGAEKVVSLDAMVYDDGDKSFEPPENDNAFQESLLSIIWDNIHKLKPRRREIMLRRYVYGQTFSEIGDAMGLSKQAVNQNLVSAEKQIREVLHVDNKGAQF